LTFLHRHTTHLEQREANCYGQNCSSGQEGTLIQHQRSNKDMLRTRDKRSTHKQKKKTRDIRITFTKLGKDGKEI